MSTERTYQASRSRLRYVGCNNNFLSIKYINGVLQTLDSMTGEIPSVDYSNATSEQNVSKNRSCTSQIYLLQQWDLTILMEASLRYVMCVYKISVFIIVITLYQF